jgi:hypothetical protein
MRIVFAVSLIIATVSASAKSKALEKSHMEKSEPEREMEWDKKLRAAHKNARSDRKKPSSYHEDNREYLKSIIKEDLEIESGRQGRN